MRILIAGNMGYIGPIVARHLRHSFPQAEIIGFDTGYFAHCLTAAHSLPETVLDRQIYGDLRDFPAELLQNIDAVVNLAAISNDAMGKRFDGITEVINQKAGLRLAEMACSAGVKNFIFASSCSIYGAAGNRTARKETDQVNPLTAYARSKIGTEMGLQSLTSDTMTITCLRFATACGMSERLRLDLVVNDFVACALINAEITVLSDGTPWRPLIEVRDMARAIEWAAIRPAANGGSYLVLNTGSDDWNYQVKDLAHSVANKIPGTRVSINTNAPADNRSYKVDFGLYKSLAPQHQPLIDLTSTIDALCDGIKSMTFTDPNFRNTHYMRLRALEDHVTEGRLDENLRWTHKNQLSAKVAGA